MSAAVSRPTLLYLVTEDWYFCSHRLPMAVAARAAGLRVVVATRVRDHGQRILDAGLELRPIGLDRRSLNPLRALSSLREMVRLYRRERPALVHHVALKPVLFGTLAACLCGVPRVINAVAGLGFVFVSDTPRARVLRPVVRAALRLALRPTRVQVLVQNDTDAAEVAALGVDRARITVIPGCGVDVQRFAPTPEPPPPLVVTMVARMLRDKGVNELVEAARVLAARGVEAEIHLVGPPDPDNPASISRAQLARWHRQGVVRWHDDSDDVPGVWARSHVAVLPSYREGLPRALLEAAACARPLVATDVPGCREVVVPGESGVRVPARDPVALADAIQTLASSAALRARLGQGARRRVLERFAEPLILEQTLGLYRALLDGARGAP